MKWCATPTPYRGLRCYVVAVQGLPGSSETLEEVMCAVLGHFVQEGFVAKIADDLYIGAATLIDLSNKWCKVLNALNYNGLKLKAEKTIVAPSHTQILGWDWNNGRLSASKHKKSPLVTCEPPKTVTSLRSFIGAYKVFNRVIRQCSKYLDELESTIAGKQKQDCIIWTDHLINVFKNAQKALSISSSIYLPTVNDQLILVHDGSYCGIGSILFFRSKDAIHVGSFFSAKLKDHHTRWLPCEIEALSISSSVSHFAPYIRESKHTTQVLTDSRPCVQAWNKMLRGEFSTSARIATFLSTLSQFNIELQHLKGSMNLPSDFISRNPPECDSKACQICSFIQDMGEIVVKNISVEEILSGHMYVLPVYMCTCYLFTCI